MNENAMTIVKKKTKAHHENPTKDHVVTNLIRITDYDDAKIAALTDSGAAHVARIRRQLRKASQKDHRSPIAPRKP